MKYKKGDMIIAVWYYRTDAFKIKKVINYPKYDIYVTDNDIYLRYTKILGLSPDHDEAEVDYRYRLQETFWR